MPDPTHRFPIEADRASVERLAGALDALVTGMPPPIDGVEVTGLVSAAERIQRIDGVVYSPAGPLPATRIDAAHRNQIWGNLMTMAAPRVTTASPGSARALPLPALNPWVADAEPAPDWSGIGGPRRRASTAGILRFVPDIQPAMTFLMVIALLVAIGAGFSGLGPPGGPGITPTASAPGDRAIVAQASPETAAGVDTPFLHPVRAIDCTVEPRPLEEVAAFLQDPGPVRPPGYLPATDADPRVAVEIARAGRAYNACGHKGQSYTRALETPRKIHEDSHNSFSNATSGSLSIAEERTLSEALLDPDPEAYVFLSDSVWTYEEAEAAFDAGQPPQIPQTMLPSHMVQLADGRIGGPLSWLHRPDGADLPPNVNAPADQGWGTVLFLIFAPDASRGGQWALDEELSLCAGDCDSLWAELSEVSGTPEASPVASPASVLPAGNRR